MLQAYQWEDVNIELIDGLPGSNKPIDEQIKELKELQNKDEKLTKELDNAKIELTQFMEQLTQLERNVFNARFE